MERTRYVKALLTETWIHFNDDDIAFLSYYATKYTPYT